MLSFKFTFILQFTNLNMHTYFYEHTLIITMGLIKILYLSLKY